MGDVNRLEWDGYCGASRVLLGQGIRENLHRYMVETGCSSSRRCLAIIDPAVANIWRTRVASWLDGWEIEIWIMPCGEEGKNLENLTVAAQVAAGIPLDPTCCIVAVGGGRVSDFAGFLASIYLRGIPWVCVPTTLLAHDSCLGGKVAVNHENNKNMLGAFHSPKLVVFDTVWLATLPRPVFCSGYAEMIKHALLVEPTFLNWLWAHRLSLLDPQDDLVPKAIVRSMQIKRRYIERDVQETRGQRVLLHLGHTFSHALEVTSGYRYMHGDALSLGLQMELVLSQRVLNMSAAEVQRVKEILIGFELPVSLLYPVDEEAMLAALRRDRKTRDGSYTFVGLQSLNSPAMLVKNVPEEDVRIAFASVPGVDHERKDEIIEKLGGEGKGSSVNREHGSSIVLPITAAIGDDGL
ncbi:3-dehydroquinate synthase family protein [Pasteuria penetrans]|uniref:3-dehydroquinate synthase family protein n=1 Tax=Pasteuria penetrans TaxID=86005 RepID=UPI000FAA095A|nr:3-dehydroquinate synthase family protein [Pasteuria penetrans]